jgi:hypothetical protein
MRKVQSGEGGVTDLGSMLNPEKVFVVQAQHPTGSARHISIHSTEAGAQRRLTRIGESWGVTLGQRDYSITQLPVEV